jgi:hypothetical protein
MRPSIVDDAESQLRVECTLRQPMQRLSGRDLPIFELKWGSCSSLRQ